MIIAGIVFLLLAALVLGLSMFAIRTSDNTENRAMSVFLFILVGLPVTYVLGSFGLLFVAFHFGIWYGLILLTILLSVGYWYYGKMTGKGF